MSNHSHKIVSICVPYSFFPIPKKLFTLLFKTDCKLCPNNYILLYLLLDKNEIRNIEIFVSLSEAQAQFLKKSNIRPQDNKIPRLELELPDDWSLFYPNKDKPIIVLPIDTTGLEDYFSIFEDQLPQYLLDYRNNIMDEIFIDMKESYQKKHSPLEQSETPEKNSTRSIKKSKKNQIITETARANSAKLSSLALLALRLVKESKISNSYWSLRIRQH